MEMQVKFAMLSLMTLIVGLMRGYLATKGFSDTHSGGEP